MRYDRDMWRRGSRGGHSGRGDASGGGLRGEYGEAYEGPFPRHGWSEGFLGGELRSRGSWDPRPSDTFEWGGGYVGGRGYGGGNYDLEHGYATGGQSFRTRPPRGALPREGDTPFSSSATRGGYAWGEAEVSEEYGPARYGYGPYFDRLRRRRRSDDEVRSEVEDTLFYDTWVDADAISVMVEDGVVTLRGTLPNYEELRYAVDDAWDVDGVRGVRSELDVRAEESESTPTSTGTREEGAGSSEHAGRYEPGAPHMHGHPLAGESAASGESGGRMAGRSGPAATGMRTTSRGGRSSGGTGTATSRRGSRRSAASEGDAGTPVPGAAAGMAAAGRSGGRRRGGSATGEATSTRGGRGGRSRAGGQGGGRGKRGAGSGEESADRTGEAGDGSVGLSQS